MKRQRKKFEKTEEIESPKTFFLGLLGFLIAFPVTFLAEMNLGPVLSNLTKQIFSSANFLE